MKHTGKKWVIAIVFICAIIFVAVSMFIPSDISDDEAFDMQSVGNIQFQSADTAINNRKFCVFALLHKNTDMSNEFVIGVARAGGILKNQYNVYCYMPQEDDYLIAPNYKNISAFPQYPIQSGSDYMGSVYFGIVPSDCIQVEINGEIAHLEHMQFDLNGKDVNFNLYYCIKEEAYQENAEVFCTNSVGEKFQIQSHDNAEYSEIIQVQ